MIVQVVARHYLETNRNDTRANGCNDDGREGRQVQRRGMHCDNNDGDGNNEDNDGNVNNLSLIHI